jgi:protein phosphatase
VATGTHTTKRPIVVSSYGITDVGLKRPHNEDSLLVKDDLGLYVVADGMGGHAKGEVASAKAISVMRDFIARCESDDEFTWPYGIDPELGDLENTIVTSVKLANREVWRISQEREDHQGMGTTIVSMRITGYDVAVAHVGDSRAYRLHEGQLLPLTEDHSWVNEQVKKGILSPEDAKDHRWKNVITRALGNKEQVDVDVSRIVAEPGDLLLLCSDGLCAGDEVPEDQIRDAMIGQYHRRAGEVSRVGRGRRQLEARPLDRGHEPRPPGAGRRQGSAWPEPREHGADVHQRDHR